MSRLPGGVVLQLEDRLFDRRIEPSPFPIYYNSLWPIGLSDRAYWPRPLAFQTHSASGGFDLAVPV
jgi:hypothetical protein